MQTYLAINLTLSDYILAVMGNTSSDKLLLTGRATLIHYQTGQMRQDEAGRSNSSHKLKYAFTPLLYTPSSSALSSLLSSLQSLLYTAYKQLFQLTKKLQLFRSQYSILILSAFLWDRFFNRNSLFIYLCICIIIIF